MTPLLKRLLIGADGRRGVLAPVPLANMNLSEEDRLSVDVSCALKEWLVTGRFQILFFHVANESGATGSKIKIMRNQQKKKALGMVPGAHDWCVMWNGGGVIIELKPPKGRLNDNQKDVQAWAEVVGVQARVAHSVEDVEQILIELEAPGVALAEAAE